MKKTSKSALKSTAAPVGAANGDLPVINREPVAETPKNHVGIFSPNVLQYPTHEELVAIVMILGLHTRQIAGKDTNSNLVDAAGNVVIPSNMRKFFQLVPVAEQAQS